MAKQIIDRVNVSSTEYNVASSAYATCATAAATVAKVAYFQGDSTSATGFVPSTGVTVHVKFTYSNTASNPTLSINGSTAAKIVKYSTVPVGITTGNSWQSGAIVSLTYDGTNWVLNDFLDDTDSHYTSYLQIKGNGTEAIKFTQNSDKSLNLKPGNNVSISAASGEITIAATDTKYTHPSYTAKSNGLYKVTIDSTGHVSEAVAVAKADITGLGIPGSDTNTDRSSLAYCTTAAGTAAKTATMPGFALSQGQRIFLRTTVTNSATSGVSLNVNSTGSFPISIAGANVTASNFPAGDYIAEYKGSSWDLTRIYLTDADTKVTAVGNHYTPAANSSAELTASLSGTAGTYAKDTEYTVLTGVKAQRDAKGHVTGITYTAQKIKDTNTTYSSKTAASGGTDVSLVTTGEKYTWNNKTSNTGTVIGSGLTDGYFVLGNGGVNVDISTMKPTTSSTAWSATSDVNVPTMKAISSYVTGLGYTTTSGDITAVTAGNGLTGGATSGAATLNVGAGAGIVVGTDAVAVDFTGSTGSAQTAARSDHTHSNYLVTTDTEEFVVVDNGAKLSAPMPVTLATVAGTAITAQLDSTINITTLTASGTVTASAFQATSDHRLKENIKPYSPTKSILDLPVVEFDYKKNKLHSIGCIAQDLQEICPEIVHEDAEGYLSINESKIVYLLLDEVKKLKAEVEALKQVK